MSADQEHNSTPQPNSAGYETRDVNLKGIFLIAALVIVVIVVILILLNEFFLMSKEELVQEQVLAPESVALRELRVHEDEVLGSYGVVDKEKAIYRVPIQRAMKLVADEAYQERVSEGER